MEKLMTTVQAAEKAGVVGRVIRYAAEAGRLEAIKVGRAWLIIEAALDQWLAEKHNPNMRRG